MFDCLNDSWPSHTARRKDCVLPYCNMCGCIWRLYISWQTEKHQLTSASASTISWNEIGNKITKTLCKIQYLHYFIYIITSSCMVSFVRSPKINIIHKPRWYMKGNLKSSSNLINVLKLHGPIFQNLVLYFIWRITTPKM